MGTVSRHVFLGRFSRGCHAVPLSSMRSMNQPFRMRFPELWRPPWLLGRCESRTCAFGRGSDLGGHAQARVAGHDAMRCRWGSNPAGPPTGRHCVPNSGRRCMRLTPWYCPSLLGVQEELVVVAATYSSPVYWSASRHCTIGPVGVWRASTREGKTRPGEAAVAGVI